jgi:hypothetical protein
VSSILINGQSNRKHTRGRLIFTGRSGCMGLRVEEVAELIGGVSGTAEFSAGLLGLGAVGSCGESDAFSFTVTGVKGTAITFVEE